MALIEEGSCSNTKYYKQLEKDYEKNERKSHNIELISTIFVVGLAIVSVIAVTVIGIWAIVNGTNSKTAQESYIVDQETGVNYIMYDGELVPRYNTDGTLYISEVEVG